MKKYVLLLSIIALTLPKLIQAQKINFVDEQMNNFAKSKTKTKCDTLRELLNSGRLTKSGKMYYYQNCQDDEIMKSLSLEKPAIKCEEMHCAQIIKLDVKQPLDDILYYYKTKSLSDFAPTIINSNGDILATVDKNSISYDYTSNVVKFNFVYNNLSSQYSKHYFYNKPDKFIALLDYQRKSP